MRTRLLKATIASLALAFTASAAAETTYKVTASTLNVRTGPSTGYKVIGQVHKGQVYASTGSSSGWHRVWFDNRAAWISGSYASRVNHGWGKVTASALNVRSGPSTGYAVVGTVPKGSSFAITRCNGAWVEIYFKGTKRWTHGGYMSKSGVNCGGSSGGSSASNPSLPKSRVGYVQMPASGTGFYAYLTAQKRWGNPSLVYGVMNAARARAAARPSYARIGVGNISLANGGYMAPHSSHRQGKDVDIRPVSTSKYEGPLTITDGRYSRARSEDLIVNFLRKHISVRQVLFNDAGIYNKYSYVKYWSGHHNHMHVSM